MTDGKNVIGLDAAIESAEERKAQAASTRAVHITWAGGGDNIDVRSDGVITEIQLWAAARLLQSLGDELFWQRRAQQQEAANSGIIVPTPGSVKVKPS